jgi:hypothetical protein
MTPRSAAFALLFSAIVLLSGCSASESVLTPTPPVVTQEATVAAAGALVDGTLPEGTPSSLPLWPESKVLAGEADKQGAFSLVLQTSDPFSDVIAGMGAGLERAGWQAAESAEESATTVLDVSGEGLEGLVTLTDADGAVTIEYFLAPTAE